MKKAKIKSIILDNLSKLAPEIDPETVDLAYSIQEEFEIDSMDFLRMMVTLDEIFGISIPESDYANVSTIEDLVNYITSKIPAESI